jgi:hypothetical protein
LKTEIKVESKLNRLLILIALPFRVSARGQLMVIVATVNFITKVKIRIAANSPSSVCDYSRLKEKQRKEKML